MIGKSSLEVARRQPVVEVGPTSPLPCCVVLVLSGTWDWACKKPEWGKKEVSGRANPCILEAVSGSLVTLP